MRRPDRLYYGHLYGVAFVFKVFVMKNDNLMNKDDITVKYVVFQDISAQVARQKLITLYERRRPNQEKLSAFLRLMKEFRPAFHYFFTEHYLDPVTWYERRLAYTKR